MNMYSIALLFACEFITCLGNIWTYLICINFGLLENLTSIFKGFAILIVAIPLCLDLSYTLLQKINPEQMVYLLEDKIKSIGLIEGVVNVRSWHFWCLDKTMRICTIHLSLKEEANPDQIKQIVEKKLLGKYVEKLTIHISQ